MKTLDLTEHLEQKEMPDTELYKKYYADHLKFNKDLKDLQDYPKEYYYDFLISKNYGSVELNLNDKLTNQTISVSENGMPFTFFPKYYLKPLENYISLQRWEGVVTKIKSNTFFARLTDKTAQNPDEEAEIPFEEIDQEDKCLLKEGAFFYWNIGYLESYSGRKRESEIRFKRIPKWTKNDIEKATKNAELLENTLKWE